VTWNGYAASLKWIRWFLLIRIWRCSLFGCVVSGGRTWAGTKAFSRRPLSFQVYYCSRPVVWLGQSMAARDKDVVAPPTALFASFLPMSVPRVHTETRNLTNGKCNIRASHTQVAHIPVTDSGFGLFPIVWETGFKLSCCSSEIGLFSMSVVSLGNTAVSTLFQHCFTTNWFFDVSQHFHSHKIWLF
jgi:hypothetical protein